MAIVAQSDPRVMRRGSGDWNTGLSVCEDGSCLGCAARVTTIRTRFLGPSDGFNSGAMRARFDRGAKITTNHYNFLTRSVEHRSHFQLPSRLAQMEVRSNGDGTSNSLTQTPFKHSPWTTVSSLRSRFKRTKSIRYHLAVPTSCLAASVTLIVLVAPAPLAARLSCRRTTLLWLKI